MRSRTLCFALTPCFAGIYPGAFRPERKRKKKGKKEKKKKKKEKPARLHFVRPPFASLPENQRWRASVRKMAT